MELLHQYVDHLFVGSTEAYKAVAKMQTTFPLFGFSDSESGIWAEACGKPCGLVLECVVSVRSRMCVMKHDSKYTRLVYTHRTRTYVKHSFQLEMVRQ